MVTTFLGLAGIFPIAMPLENMSIAMSQIIPLSPWIVMTWWCNNSNWRDNRGIINFRV